MMLFSINPWSYAWISFDYWLDWQTEKQKKKSEIKKPSHSKEKNPREFLYVRNWSNKR